MLNQLCNELAELEKLDAANPAFKQLVDFKSCLKHLIWLDGGHSGNSDSWITKEDIVDLIKRMHLICYVYVTPYQLKSRKLWAIEEYEKFCALLEKINVDCKKIYYFQDKEDDFDVNFHFEVLKEFDANLII